MTFTLFEKPAGPWYHHFDFWSDLASRYFRAYRKIPSGVKHYAELRAFSLLTIVRLVFESNLIEGAGLSEGETRKIIEEYFPQIPDDYEMFRPLYKFHQYFLPKKDVVSHKNDMRDMQHIIPTISFENKSKPEREVLQHVEAYEIALSHAIDAIERMQRSETVAPFSFITEEMIKRLHAVIADGILPDDAKVKAGEYRIDVRSVGFEVVFPSPELIPDCMTKFTQDANALFFSYFTDDANMFEIAARISYDFVRIHPFPDFNGRVSRLLLAMILHAYGIPFAVSVRGNKKGRERYMTSLKHANTGKITSYAALIAMQVAETFGEIDENIQRAGYPSLLSFL